MSGEEFSANPDELGRAGNEIYDLGNFVHKLRTDLIAQRANIGDAWDETDGREEEIERSLKENLTPMIKNHDGLLESLVTAFNDTADYTLVMKRRFELSNEAATDFADQWQSSITDSGTTPGGGDGGRRG
ncbi:hypothetical protein ACQEU5_04285 [Marinactinospora thermotolerans]|uniref:WXG100 family type VII secretion target n=1 Tax=Marinactinospora thermotolerans DSM 45154 TaxID=1122192 RepID=A0A1T4QC46_9ACTN|nr:hypothetical protein [Marinactinospora thermotolerans]SKA01309.1 hypothetical protein SAMN02745673_02149 [Marinactinospora thermotolerans DSM 45154]